MAKTSFATNDPLTKKAWEEKLFRETVKESYFDKYMGSGSDSIIQTQTQFTKDKGDQITFGIRMRLKGAGVVSGQPLEGNEERLQTNSYNLLLEQYRHAVRDDGAMSRQRAMFSIDEEAKIALKDWGSEKIDSLMFGAAFGTIGRFLYPEGTAGNFTLGTVEATVKSSLTAAQSKLTPDFVTKLGTWARTGGARKNSFSPIRPVKVKGHSYVVLLVHPDAAADIRLNPDWKQGVREAADRGMDNPIFTGATAIWGGVVIQEHENAPIGLDAGAGNNVPYAKGILLGAQSLVWAWGKRPEIISKDFDYDNEHGYAIDMICAPGKPTFTNGVGEYGSVGVYLARTQISDI